MRPTEKKAKNGRAIRLPDRMPLQTISLKQYQARAKDKKRQRQAKYVVPDLPEWKRPGPVEPKEKYPPGTVLCLTEGYWIPFEKGPEYDVETYKKELKVRTLTVGRMDNIGSCLDNSHRRQREDVLPYPSQRDGRYMPWSIVVCRGFRSDYN